MSLSTTVLGLPYPESTDDADGPGAFSALVAVLDALVAGKKLTQVQIDALSAGQKPAGLIVYNQTTGRAQISDGSSFHTLPIADAATFTGTLTAAAAVFTGAVDARVNTNAQTGTTYTLVLADAGKLVTLSNASAITLTVPPNSSAAYGTGTKIDLVQLGAGQVTVAPGSGVTINSYGSKVALAGQYAAATLVKTGSDTWLLVGNLA